MLLAPACGGGGGVQTNQIAILNAPPLVEGSGSKLTVPASCPVYAPGGGDVGTVEPPFNEGVTAVCGVDDQGNTYGLIQGDAPTAKLNVLPGNHELGVFVGFDGKFALAYGAPTIEAWAAPTNIQNSTDCCADLHPDARIPVTVVALGDSGLLFSVGQFDSTPIQVAYNVTGSVVGNAERFYVNGAP